MVAIKLPVFSGMVPSIDDHLLAETNAAYSNNAWLYSGALNGTPAKTALQSLVNPNTTVAFRATGPNDDPLDLFSGKWIEFENINTDFIKAPVSADQFNRYYWTSTSQPPTYNTYARIAAGQPPFLLGIPQAGPVSVAASGGSSSTLVSRAYLTTLVSAYGEEGPASDPFLINGKADDTFAVTVAGVLASDMGVNRNINRIRLYRTITSAAGTATYYLLAELPASASPQNFNDTVSDATLSSAPILESTAWTAPPALEGFVVMPNGIVAGYMGKELYFSEAYRPHAWPVAYSLTLEHEIVGLAVVNQTLVVCTNGNPVAASGVNPASITTSKLAPFEPCLSKGSIVSSEEGVFYASPNGLILVNAGMAANITKQYISRDLWAKVANQGRINACRLGSSYYAFETGASAAFQQSAFQQNAVQLANEAGTLVGFMIDPSNSNVGFTFLSDTVPVVSVANDIGTGDVILVKDGKIWAARLEPGYQTEPYKWTSKIFQTPEVKNFSAFKVFFYEDENYMPSGPANFDKGQQFNPANQQAIVRVYGDGKLVLTHELRKSGELHRLPSGYKAAFWQVEFEARVKIKSFQMATSVKELSIV